MPGGRPPGLLFDGSGVVEQFGAKYFPVGK